MRPLSLRYRIAGTMLFLQALVLGLMLWRVLTLARQNGYEQLATAQTIALGLLETQARQALLTAEYDQFHLYLRGLTSDPRIVTVLLLDEHGRVVASTHPADITEHVDLVDSGDRFWVRRPISNVAGVLGTLALQFSSAPIETSYRDAWAEGVTIGLLGLVAIALVSVSLGFVLTRRLDRLANGAIQLAEGGRRVATGVRGADEIGRLGEAFDYMATRIAENVAALQHARDELEERVVERTAELANAKEAAEDLAGLKSRFVSMASHEFRTPLTVIQNAADLLRLYSHKLAVGERQAQIEKITAQVSHMTKLLDGVLTLGRADAGKLMCNPVRLELSAFCADLAREAELASSPPHVVRLSYHGPSGRVSMDPTLLRHILGNLLSNATKFSPAEGPVDFEVSEERQWVRFCISDSGIGIQDEDRPGLFEPFYRGANVGIIPGTGLGLTVAKRAVELHNGTIDIESQPGRGTSVTVMLPLPEED